MSNRTEAVQNKSSLILKIILQNPQTLQLSTINIKIDVIYKIYKNANRWLGLRTLKFYQIKRVERKS